MIPECNSCEFKRWPARCHAAETGHRRLCDLAHDLGREDYRDLISRLTLGSQPPETHQPADAAKLMRVSTCLHRRSDCNCLDKPAYCHKGITPAVVALADCLACLARDESA